MECCLVSLKIPSDRSLSLLSKRASRRDQGFENETEYLDNPWQLEGFNPVVPYAVRIPNPGAVGSNPAGGVPL
jgi:hypothetical protein